jgi:hypothetical protein
MDLPITVMSINKSKGFLKKKARLNQLVAVLRNPEAQQDEQDDALAQFVLLYTIEPADREKALEVILDMTGEELTEATNRINGVGIVPLAKDALSETITSSDQASSPNG